MTLRTIGRFVFPRQREKFIMIQIGRFPGILAVTFLTLFGVVCRLVVGVFGIVEVIKVTSEAILPHRTKWLLLVALFTFHLGMTSLQRRTLVGYRRCPLRFGVTSLALDVQCLVRSEFLRAIEVAIGACHTLLMRLFSKSTTSKARREERNHKKQQSASPEQMLQTIQEESQ